MDFQQIQSIKPDDILIMWSLSLLYGMWRTRSIKMRSSITMIVITISILSILHKIFGEVGCMYILMAVITWQVWDISHRHTSGAWGKK